MVKNLPAKTGDMDSVLGREDPTFCRASTEAAQLETVLCTREATIMISHAPHRAAPARRN